MRGKGECGGFRDGCGKRRGEGMSGVLPIWRVERNVHSREGEWDRPTVNAAIWKEWRERAKERGDNDDGEEKNARRAGKVEERQRCDVQYCSIVVGGAWKNTHTHTHTSQHQ